MRWRIVSSGRGTAGEPRPMSPAGVCLAKILAIVAVGTTIGFLAGARRRMDLEQWTVGGRGFGVALVFLLMAGEVYTTFAFLGASGWAYSRGGPTLYVLAYLTLGYVVSFFILPQIWEAGRRHGMQTQSDFFPAATATPGWRGSSASWALRPSCRTCSCRSPASA